MRRHCPLVAPWRHLTWAPHPLLPQPGPLHPGLFPLSNTQLAGAEHTLGALENQVYFWSFCQNIKKRKTKKTRQEHGGMGARQKREKVGAVIGRTLRKRQRCDGTRWAGTIRVARQDMGASYIGLQDGEHQAKFHSGPAATNLPPGGQLRAQRRGWRLSLISP